MDEANEILAGYAAASRDLIDRFEDISSEDLYSVVRECLPTEPSRIVDVGAGTGRDAAWFARQGHHVLAIEPVEAFRIAGKALHGADTIEWLDDCLPDLKRATDQGVFDLVTLCGVWQHLDDDARSRAIARLAKLVAPDGLLIMSLRHGPGAETRRVFPVDVDTTIESAVPHHLVLVRQAEAVSVQSTNRERGVVWSWLVFKKPRLHAPSDF